MRSGTQNTGDEYLAIRYQYIPANILNNFAVVRNEVHVPIIGIFNCSLLLKI